MDIQNLEMPLVLFKDAADRVSITPTVSMLSTL